jgi:hypothetical protein
MEGQEMPKYTFSNGNEWNDLTWGWGYLWVCPNHCSLDLGTQNAGNDYFRYVPPGAENFANSGALPTFANADDFRGQSLSGELPKHFERIDPGKFTTVELDSIDYAAAKVHCKMGEDAWDDKGLHKGTRTIFGKLNQNQFSRMGRVIEIAYRYYFNAYPDQKPKSPLVQWTHEDLLEYARACSSLAQAKVLQMEEQELSRGRLVA